MVHYPNPTDLVDISRGHHSSYRGVKGSIVRLKIYDFMTYHKVELRAGPNVNLILGPNGTGKSTIVCAICIGLAGKPKILGRAISLKEYIRHDCKSASIEIELYNPDGDNFVVKRGIKASQNSANSTWSLNGKKASQNQIESLLSTLNIQLDNLCQFLPQDRVQEFSKMDSYSLLRSTQLAMGKDTLIKIHDELMNLNQLMRQIDQGVKNSSDSLKAEQQLNQRLENEVRNYHERQRFQEKIEELRGFKAWIVYVKARQGFCEANRQLDTLKTLKKDSERQLEPLKKSVRQMETKLSQLNREMTSCRTSSNMFKAVKSKYEEECNRIEVKINEINLELEAMEKRESDRQSHVESARTKLESLENQLVKFDGENDVSSLESDVTRLTNAVNSVTEAHFKIQEEISTDEQEIRSLNDRIRRWGREIDHLGDLRVSRLKFMERERKDAYKAVEFFSKEENKAKLRGKIHEPMILHICVSDLKYGPIVERHLGIADMTAFFCEDKDDLEVMLGLMKPLGLRISIIHHAHDKNWVKPKPSYKPEYLRPFGFTTTLIQLIQAPDYYLSYMTKKHRVHDIPIGRSPDTDRKFKEISTQTQIQAFYTDENSYFIKKSNYSNGTCTSVDFLPQAKVFTTEINAAERVRIEEEVREANVRKSEIENRLKSRKIQMERVEQDRMEKESEASEARKKVEHRKNLIQKIAIARRGKEQLERDVPDLNQLKSKAEKDVWNEREKQLTHLDWSINELDKHARKSRELIVLKRQVSALQSRIITKQNTLDELQASINQRNAEMASLAEQVETRAAEAEEAKKEAVGISGVNEPPKEVTEGKISIQDIDRDITQAQSQMDFLIVTNPSIVSDYQERLKKIEKLQQERGKSVMKLSGIKHQLEQKKIEWLTPLQSLIDRINKNFGTFFGNMGCAGEVSLCHGEEEDDFSKYGIKIMVKFRNSEPLAEMCGTRVGTLQSGGERVITTALYVLALQELTVVPFRVIDEINQGMDAKNESRFFNLLCSLARGTDTPQYFLLTPKMLPPIEYPENVDFHFIMNGPKVTVPAGDGEEGEDEDDEDEDDESDDE